MITGFREGLTERIWQRQQVKVFQAGRYGIRINDQRRVCFRREDGNAFDVEITTTIDRVKWRWTI